jgi:uncharacterized lipoprotein
MRIAVIILVCCWISGCALTTQTIDVPYQPVAGEAVQPVPGAENAVVAVHVVDSRTTYRDRVSSKKNGYGMEMAAIIASNEIPLTLQQALDQELQSRGFKIGENGPILTLELVKFYNDFKNGFFSGDANAEVAFNAKLTRPDNSLLFTKYYDASGTEPNIQLTTGSNARAALIQAFRNAVHSAVTDPDLINAILTAQGASSKPSS